MADFFGRLSFRRKRADGAPGLRIVNSQATQPRGAGPEGMVSPLLHQVLGETKRFDRANESKDSARLQPLSERLGVGGKLAAAKRQTAGVAHALTTFSDEDTAQAIRTLVEGIETRVCCVAFAGQMKAGKSSLINVLVETPDLLPSGINPWTTVITRLHFGVPGKPRAGASFTFFDPGEWGRLSAGGRTRELTEQLFPGFDWKALSSQVEAMQERARQKLGDRFEDLLGTEHVYPDITPHLLNRYVGAGHPGDTDCWEGAEGEFSDITKLADVFLDLGAFSYPTVLIDTPGVNDPFLVRDEITRQNLEAAGICVIVLTARQPLSTADLSLLRMLRGLKKDRLIIFVNKIDEIDGGEEVLREVSGRLSAVLQQEFPAADIPIVFGSAQLAREALALSASLQEKADLDANGPALEFFDWPDQAEITGTLAAETLFSRSGLSSLAVAVSGMMRDGPIAAELATADSLLKAVGENLICWFETQIEILGPSGLDFCQDRTGKARRVKRTNGAGV